GDWSHARTERSCACVLLARWQGPDFRGRGRRLIGLGSARTGVAGGKMTSPSATQMPGPACCGSPVYLQIAARDSAGLSSPDRSAAVGVGGDHEDAARTPQSAVFRGRFVSTCLPDGTIRN